MKKKSLELLKRLNTLLSCETPEDMKRVIENIYGLSEVDLDYIYPAVTGVCSADVFSILVEEGEIDR